MAMEKFHYTLPDGYEFVLPKLEDVPVGLIRKTRKLERTDQAFTLLESILSGSDLEHLDTLTRTGLNDLMGAWRDASTIGLGES